MHLSLLGRRTILSKFTSYWTGLSTNDPEPYHVLTIDLLLLIPRELLKLILDFSDISTIFSLSRTSNKYLNLISSDTNIKTVRLDSVSNGHCDLFKWLVTNVRYDSTSFVEHAVKNGRLEILKYLNGTRNRNSCDYLFHYACRDAAANGHLDVLRYLREHFCLWDEYTYLGAAKGGHLDIIKYLHENKCPSDLDGYALKYAATNGDLVMIKYLHEIRFPWNTRVFQSAAKNGLWAISPREDIGADGKGDAHVLPARRAGDGCLRDAIDAELQEVKIRFGGDHPPERAGPGDIGGNGGL